MTIPQSRISDLELRTLISMVDTFEVDTCGKTEYLETKEIEVQEWYLDFKIKVDTIQHSHFVDETGRMRFKVDRTTEVWMPLICKGENLIILTDEQEKIFEKEMLNKITVR
jgi:hypothetical protein